MLSDFLNIVNTPEYNDFSTLFFGIIIEALPFVLLGVLVSILVGLYVDTKVVFKYLPKNRILSHIILSLLGVFMPVCECGNVPVLRRLLSKGFSVSHAVTFLLAAPILNPITAWSTYEAFKDIAPEVIWIRLLAAFIIANLVGLIISTFKDQESLLTPAFYEEVCAHDHSHEQSKFAQAVDIFQTEFVEVMKMMVLGAFIAASIQIFVPRDVILEIGSNPVLSIISMLVLAFVVSICANVDAFFALSYSAIFSIGSLVSFLVFGPMIDIKILTMLKTTFKMRFLIELSILIAFLSFVTGLIVNLFI